jgi:protein gp37
MAENTLIQYTHHSWNPWLGCKAKPGHPGCDNCYAADMAHRLGVTWGALGQGTRWVTAASTWKLPYRWQRVAERNDRLVRVFVSLCDPFEAWGGQILKQGAPLETGPEWRDRRPIDAVRHNWFTGVIDETPNLRWILATKRPENIRRLIPGRARCALWPDCSHPGCLADHYWPNIWLMTSVSDQATYDRMAPLLIQQAHDLAPVLALSLEPLLEPINLGELLREFQWIVVGGESGKHARPCEFVWIKQILEQCRQAGVPCYVKQAGANVRYTMPGDIRHPKGGNPEEWPPELRVRQLPREKANL